MRIATLSLLGLSTVCLRAQSPTAPPPVDSGYTLHATTNEVLLDLVVRDKHERIVTKLKPEDIQIYQDGVLQPVKGFRLIQGKEQLAEERSAAAHQSQPNAAPAKSIGQPAQTVRNVNLVALVFRSGSPQGRAYSREAALAFLDSQILPHTYIGVFNLGARLGVLQPFTQDKDLLLKAVDMAAKGSPDQMAEATSAVMSQIQTTLNNGREGLTVDSQVDPAQTAGLATAGASQGFSEGDRLAAGVIQQYLMDSSQTRGMDTLDAINALTRGLGKFPGRKTVLYMSEGMTLPPSGREFFDAAISNANRANVSFYMVDTRGLMSGGQPGQGAATNSLRRGAALSRMQSDPTMVFATTHQDDILEYGVHTADDQGTMGELAMSTGGTLIANTNDIRKPLARVMEDIRTHYEVTFAPPAGSYDGHFRKIEVRLAKNGWTAQTRNGYFAVPSFHGEAVLPSELANLAALDAKTKPRAFPLHAAVLQYRPGPDSRQCDVNLEVPMSGLKFVPDGKGMLNLHVTFVALIKDASGQVVEKVGHDITYSVPEDKRDGFNAGNLTFSHPMEVPPGRYTIEASAVDQFSSAASVKRVAFVAGPAPGLALSSLALVRRVSPLKEARNRANPLEFDGGRVDVDLSSTEKADGDVSLYFVVYPQPGVSANPNLTMQFFRDGREIATDKPTLTAPDETGGIPLLAKAKLAPGPYEVRVTARQAGKSAQQSLAFEVE